MPLEEAAGKFTKSIAVSIDGSDQSKELLVSLKEMLGNYSHGNCSIFFSVTNGSDKPRILQVQQIRRS